MKEIVLVIIGFIIALAILKSCGNETVAPDYKSQLDSLSDKLDSLNKDKRADTLQVYYQNELKKKDSAYSADRKILNLQIANLLKNSLLKTFIPGSTNCDSLASEYEGYVSLTQREREIADSLLSVKDSEIANRDSLATLALEQLDFCKSTLRSSIELAGLMYMSAAKNKPRNVLSIVASGAYYPNQIAVGGGLHFKFKNDVGVSGLVLFGNQKIYQANIYYPIKFRK